MGLGEGIGFLAKFMREPTLIGALWPSSEHLARMMVEWIRWESVDAAVEFGPGTGSFTRHIVGAMKPGTRLVAIEFQPALAEALRAEFPHITVCHGDVVDVPSHCANAGVESVQAIISGLPWAFFEEEKQKAILEASARVLVPGGQLVTFAYLQGLLLPAGQRFRRLLRQTFSEVHTSRTEWRNLPPAFVYRCTR